MTAMGINGVDWIRIETADGSSFGLTPNGSGDASTCWVNVDGYMDGSRRQSYLYAETADGLRGVDTGATYSLGSVSYKPAPHTVDFTIKAEGGIGLTQANWLLSSLSTGAGTLFVHTNTNGARELNRTAIFDDRYDGNVPVKAFSRTYTQRIGLVSANITRGTMVSEIKMTIVLLDGLWLDYGLSQATFSFTSGYYVALTPDTGLDWSTAGAACVLPYLRVPGPIAYKGDIRWYIGSLDWDCTLDGFGKTGNMVENDSALIIDIKNKKIYNEKTGENLLYYIYYASLYNKPTVNVLDGIQGGFRQTITATHAGTVKFYSYYRGINY